MALDNILSVPLNDCVSFGPFSPTPNDPKFYSALGYVSSIKCSRRT